jgi:hypothetical protein
MEILMKTVYWSIGGLCLVSAYAQAVQQNCWFAVLLGLFGIGNMVLLVREWRATRQHLRLPQPAPLDPHRAAARQEVVDFMHAQRTRRTRALLGR